MTDILAKNPPSMARAASTVYLVVAVLVSLVR